MKIKLLALGIFAISLTGFSQGKIGFGNDSSRPFVVFGDVPGGQPMPQSPLPSGIILQALLYAGTTSGSLALQTAVPLTGANWLSPGQMAIKNISLSGVSGGATAYFKVLWVDTDTILPATMDGNIPSRNFFINASWYFATSELFTAVPGGSIIYPALYDTIGSAQSTWLVGEIANIPEPSGATLTALGVILMQFRRRYR